MNEADGLVVSDWDKEGDMLIERLKEKRTKRGGKNIKKKSIPKVRRNLSQDHRTAKYLKRKRTRNLDPEIHLDNGSMLIDYSNEDE